MKNITKILIVALMVIVATISVSAANVELNLTDAGVKGDYTSGVYYLDVVATDSLYTNVLDLKFTFNTDKIELFCMDGAEYGYFPLNEDVDAAWYDYAETALVLGTNGQTGLQKATYEKSYVKATVDGNKCTVQFTTNAPAGKLTKFPKENFKAFQVGLYIADVDALTADDFKIEHVFMDTWDGADAAAKYGFGSWSEPVAGQITVDNNVIPEVEETKLTIAVATGDVVYLQDGTVVTIAEANEAYEIPTTAGTVVVNTVDADGVQTAQKVYTVADGAVTADTTKADGVLATNEASIRGDNVYNGIRYKSTFLTALKDVVDEYGYITTVESAYNALPDDYVLNMALVDAGKAVKDVAYDDETDIFWNVDGDKTVVTAVVTNVPMTEEGVTTNIVIRPYYKVGSLVVYGEPMTRTVYEVALNIKENDAETYAKYQEYIDEILALCEETDVVIDFGPLFK